MTPRKTCRGIALILIPVAVTLGAATPAKDTTPVDRSIEIGEASERACTFNITARNTGNSDIRVMLYDSRVKTLFCLGCRWNKLKVQNHRVAPNRLMSRSFRANGACGSTRSWEIRLKKGSNFTRVQYKTNSYTPERNGYKHLDLGNLSTRF